jgi:hypothetical protein
MSREKIFHQRNRSRGITFSYKFYKLKNDNENEGYDKNGDKLFLGTARGFFSFGLEMLFF